LKGRRKTLEIGNFGIRELEKRQSHTHDTYKDEEADISCNNSQDGQMGLGHIP
jgi:hypothetical protein